MSRTPLNWPAPQGAGALAGRRIALVIANPGAGLLLNLDATATSAVRADALVGTPALTFTGMIGAALA